MTPLRVHRIKPRCEVLGPGVRAVVWFQGCRLDCPGCIAWEMNRSADFQRFQPEELAARLAAVEGIEGITLSGGDPFDQPLESFAEFLNVLRSRSFLSVVCYTGRTFEELLDHPQAKTCRQILSEIDLLIDGPYIEELNDGSLWRGSSNQRLLPLTDRYKYLFVPGNSTSAGRKAIPDKGPRSLEIEVSPTNELTIAGIPPPGFMATLRSRLAERGYELACTAPTVQGPNS